MHVPYHPGRSAPLRLLLALVIVALAPGRARAQTCPSISLTITRTTAAGDPAGPDQDAQLTGSPEVVFAQQGTFDVDTWQSQYLLNIYAPDGVLVWQTASSSPTRTGSSSPPNTTWTGRCGSAPGPTACSNSAPTPRAAS